MGSYYGNILEEELKNKVGAEWFPGYDTTQILGKVDFAVAVREGSKNLFDTQYLLWAESKQGTSHDILESFIQLILTIGREHTNLKYVPPTFLGAFDAEKIAFLPYHKVMAVFTRNDIDWTVTPSNHTTKTFKYLLLLLQGFMEKEIVVFHYGKDGQDLKKFIAHASDKMGGVNQIQVTINNLQHVYTRWREEVMPTIEVDWAEAKKDNLIDADFFLADLLSKDNATIGQKLYVLLDNNHYVFDRRQNKLGFLQVSQTQFNDHQKAHSQFWKRYKRPPQRKYWDEMVERRDLLVPQDLRERHGSFFTPQQWVQLSQEYLARELGDDWQDKYYVWDCCGGTGNMEVGLTNKYNIYVSTLEKADVDVMHQRIEAMEHSGRGGKGGSNLLASHVFQFDFLNDPFDLDSPDSKLPSSLRDILRNPKERERLVIYINPPYAEVSSKKVNVNGEKGKKKVNISQVHTTYKTELGTAGRELYTQFMIRIIKELPGCYLGEFSTLKTLQGSAFITFRKHFNAKLQRLFLMPASTFDNVKGQFPIGFFIWNTQQLESFKSVVADVYDAQTTHIGQKCIYSFGKSEYINAWISLFKKRKIKKKKKESKGEKGEKAIGFLAGINGNDFQHNNYVYIVNGKSQVANPRGIWITGKNLLPCSIYMAVRHVIPATWLNDRDQFLAPNDGWKSDALFQTDCLAYTLFSNNIQSKYGENHWIPFYEDEVGARERMQSHFMQDYIHGKSQDGGLFGNDGKALEFSEAAKAVLASGKRLWRYYHKQPGSNPDASLYDIRFFFQGVNEKGKMNATSGDATYNALIGDLRLNLKALAKCIEPKVYEYGFLRK